LPTARAFQLFSLVAHNGEHALGVTLGGDATSLRGYAVTHSGGTALVLFNLDQNNKLPVTIAIDGVTSASSMLVNSYDRAIYDRSQTNVWAGPLRARYGATALPVSLVLQPWSMTVVRLAP
jgi:hypothetical protein